LPEVGSAPTWHARFAPARSIIGGVEHPDLTQQQVVGSTLAAVSV